MLHFVAFLVYKWDEEDCDGITELFLEVLVLTSNHILMK